MLTALCLFSSTVTTVTEGTDSSQGTPQLLSNISSCLAVANVVATTLGPRGMDKLIVDANVRSDAPPSMLASTCHLRVRRDGRSGFQGGPLWAKNSRAAGRLDCPRLRLAT